MLDLLKIQGLKPVEFGGDHGALVIKAEILEEPARPRCPVCGKPMPRHTSREQSYEDILPITVKPVKVALDMPRFYCKTCHKTAQADLPFLDEKRRITSRLMWHIRSVCLEKPFRRLAGDTELPVNTIRNIALDLIAELDQVVKARTPALLGIAELPRPLGKHLALYSLSADTIVEIFERGSRSSVLHQLQKVLDVNHVEWLCIGPTALPQAGLSRCFPNATLVDVRQGEAGDYRGVEYRGIRGKLAQRMLAVMRSMEEVSEHFDPRCKFKILRGRLLYPPLAREAAMSVSPVDGQLSQASRAADFGALIRALVELANGSAFDESAPRTGGK